MAGRLEGKIAIVMGAGSVPGDGTGNGKAIAILFAREGAKVVAVDRSPEAVAITRDLVTEEGGTCETCIADVTVAGDVERVMLHCLERFGAIDILVNNVGIGIVGDPVDQSEEDWDRVMRVNVKSVFLACKYALPHMASRQQGAIVNISSLAGIRFLGIPYISYAASKAAVNQATRTIAMTYARRGIRANAVVPGVIDTPMSIAPLMDHYGDLETIREARRKLSPTGTLGDPWDVAYAALYLASPEAKYVNGIELIVDGGLHCQVAPAAA